MKNSLEEEDKHKIGHSIKTLYDNTLPCFTHITCVWFYFWGWSVSQFYSGMSAHPNLVQFPGISAVKFSSAMKYRQSVQHAPCPPSAG